METLPLIRGLVEVKYPAFLTDLDIRVKIPFLADSKGADFTISLPKIVFKALFYLGLARSVYFFYKLVGKGKTTIWQFILSCFNSKKYLKSSVDRSLIVQNYSAVIYGATNKAGKAYS